MRRSPATTTCPETERPARASQTAGKVATYNWTDKDGQGGCYGGNLYNEIKGIWERADRNEKALAQLTALVAAQQTALDTLAKSLGANPADIAEIVAGRHGQTRQHRRHLHRHIQVTNRLDGV